MQSFLYSVSALDIINICNVSLQAKLRVKLPRSLWLCFCSIVGRLEAHYLELLSYSCS